MRRVALSLMLLAAAALVFGATKLPLPAPEACPTGASDIAGVCPGPPSATRPVSEPLAGDTRAVRYDEEEDDEGEEAPALTGAEAWAIESAVWDHLYEEMWWHHGVYRVAEIWDRHLVPIWAEHPREVAEDRFEVAMEFMAVQSPPADFPTVDEAGVPPRRVPRTAEEAVRARARIRGPSSWQITFEVEWVDDDYEVVGVTITGRPGERRAPWREIG